MSETTKAIEALPERSPTDFALEHAEYMAKDAERLLDALNEHSAALMALEEGDEPDVDADVTSLEERVEHAEQDLGEYMSHMRSGVYEFRKRRDRALAAAQAEQAKPDALGFSTHDREALRIIHAAAEALKKSDIWPSPPSDREPAGTPPTVEQFSDDDLRRIAVLVPMFSDDTNHAHYIRLMRAALAAEKRVRIPPPEIAQVRRYYLHGEFMKESAFGDYVRFDDIAAAPPQADRADAEILGIALKHAYSLMNAAVEQNGTLPKHLITEIRKVLPADFPAGFAARATQEPKP